MPTGRTLNMDERLGEEHERGAVENKEEKKRPAGVRVIRRNHRVF
jgi:hypothetical protein